jgi:UDP-glucose 4-epimerase
VLVEAPKPSHGLYNISTGNTWTALQWGRHLAGLNLGFVCRLAKPGEAPTVDLHSDADRSPLSISRMAEEFGWRARFGCADSAADLNEWLNRHREGM